MSGSLSDVATLRQRVLDSLTRRGGDTLMPSTDDDIEEGEIQEAVDVSIQSNSKTFWSEAPRASIQTTPAHFPIAIPGLNGTRSKDAYSHPLAQTVVTKELPMPHDLPINFPPIHLNPALNVTKFSATSAARTAPYSSGDHIPPWLTKTLPVTTKRPFSNEFATNGRPQKKLGTQRHKSLVIDLESDDEDLRDPASTDQVNSTSDATTERQASAAKLRQVEAEIAQAMAVINRAQQIQNARKTDSSRSSTPTLSIKTPLPICIAPEAHIPMQAAIMEKSMTTDAARTITETPDVVNQRPKSLIELQALQAEVSALDLTISRDRKTLMSSRIESAEVQKQRNIAEIRRSDCQHVMRALQHEIARLQQELVQEQDLIRHIDKEASELDRVLESSITLQNQLAAQVNLNEEKRQVHQAKISPLRRTITQTNIGTPPNIASVQNGVLSTAEYLNPSQLGQPLPSVPQDFVQQPESDFLRKLPESIDTPNEGSEKLKKISDVNSSYASVHHKESQFPVVQSTNSKPPVAISGAVPLHDQRMNVRDSSSTPQAPVRNDSLVADESSTSSIQEQKDSHQIVTPSKDHDPVTKESSRGSSLPYDETVALFAPVNVAVKHTKVHRESSAHNYQDGPQLLYSSPLASFKNFKYHPQYVQTVSSGFRSPTYFHKIHQDISLCRFETQGGICNAAGTCKDQHFEQLLMTDDEILIELSCATVGKTTKEKTAYRDGLRGVLQKMKTENIDDFNLVCARMIEYRRTRQEHENQSISSFF